MRDRERTTCDTVRCCFSESTMAPKGPIMTSCNLHVVEWMLSFLA